MKASDGIFKITQTISFKFVLIGFLSLVLLIPVAWIRVIISERQMRQTEVMNEISSSWGNEQVFTGPVLTIPYRKFIEREGKMSSQTEFAHFLPSNLKITGKIDPEIRYRGIFKIAVYNAVLLAEGTFDKPDMKSLGIEPQNADFTDAFISNGITDMRGIKNDVKVIWNGKEEVVNPGIPVRDISTSGFHCGINLNDSANREETLTFRVELSLNGSSSLHFYPVGKNTEVILNSSWADPAFEGSFLPIERDIKNNGFTASWKVTHLNRNYPQSWTNKDYNIDGSDFGVGLFLPVSHYQKAERSAKYAIMFIGLTFLLFLLIEILNRRRLHPVQYLLTGLSLSIFYILLVSLSEQIGFGLAYLISAIAIILLICFYIQNGYQNFRLTIITSAVLILLFGFLYVILQIQDYALLFGSIGLFVVLGTFMYLTRKINWYKEEVPLSEQDEVI